MDLLVMLPRVTCNRMLLEVAGPLMARGLGMRSVCSQEAITSCF